MAAHEFDWHRLATIVTKPPTEEVDPQWFDVEALQSDWHPKIFFPDNLPEFRSGLVLHDTTIEVALSDRPGFPEDPDYKEPEQAS
jgi:hypothetical protein